MVFRPHSIRGWCFFVEKLSSSLQDPIFSGIFRIFRGLFELDLLL